MRRALAAGAVLAALAGCGGGSGGGGGATQTVTQTTTRVDVISGAGAARFDARRIYDREAQGVVTVISVFSRDGLASLFGDDKSAGLGSGFVVSGEGEVVTNAHVVTQGEGRDLERADHVYVQFRDRNQVPAKILGVDPNADVALLRVDPEGLDLRPLPLASPDSVQVG
ncbi:MAG TPA: trypsin-like peptidase domain-containing protein, partial [Nannocystaceae bacterium]|nr:trypsin-like peptidase domain-containing protein [Nannocystaceae bacterium]